MSLAFNRSDARADDTVEYFRRVCHIFLTYYLFRKVILVKAMTSLYKTKACIYMVLGFVKELKRTAVDNENQLI